MTAVLHTILTGQIIFLKTIGLTNLKGSLSDAAKKRDGQICH